MTTTTRSRLAGLDRLRGLGVVLMVVDHVLVVFGPSWAPWVRLTATRASLPLFCLVAGSFVAGRAPRWERLALASGAGMVASVIGAPIGIGQPDILLLLVPALVAAHYATRSDDSGVWLVVLVVAILQPVTWPIPWPGYQPGVVAALVLVGAMVSRCDLDVSGWRLPAIFELAGRWPLALYVGHLAVLYVAVGR